MGRNWFIRTYRAICKVFMPKIIYLRKSLDWISRDFEMQFANAKTDKEKGTLGQAESHVTWEVINEIRHYETNDLVRKAHKLVLPVPRKPPTHQTDENWDFDLDWGYFLTTRVYSELRGEVRAERDARRKWWAHWIPTFISALVLLATIGIYWETRQDRKAADAAYERVQAVEQKITDMVLNQIVLSEFMQEGIDFGGKFILDSEVQSSIDSILALAIPKPMDRQEWSERLLKRIADARIKREEMRKKK